MKAQNIGDQFVSYEIALAFEELGFDEPCLMFIACNDLWFCNGAHAEFYDECSNDPIDIGYKFLRNHSALQNDLQIPLYQQAIDWFREKHQIWINPVSEYQGKFLFVIADQSDSMDVKTVHIKEESYFKSREQAILKAIELCKRKK